MTSLVLWESNRLDFYVRSRALMDMDHQSGSVTLLDDIVRIDSLEVEMLPRTSFYTDASGIELLQPPIW